VKYTPLKQPMNTARRESQPPSPRRYTGCRIFGNQKRTEPITGGINARRGGGRFNASANSALYPMFFIIGIVNVPVPTTFAAGLRKYCRTLPRENRYQGRPAADVPQQRLGKIDKKFACARGFQKRAEQDKQKNKRGGYAERDAEIPAGERNRFSRIRVLEKPLCRITSG
jgi:hypothetical protein